MKVYLLEYIVKCHLLRINRFIKYITGALKCVSINNQECKARPKVVDFSSNNPIFYLFSVKIKRCSGNCNSINDPYAKICVSDVVENLNVKVFNLMSRSNESRSIKSHETCKCICRLNKIICNNKQRWNKDQCRCECKELIDKGVCDKGYIFNQSNCKCECDKSCNTSQYLDYLDCKCKKKIVDLIVEEYTEYDDNKTKLIIITVTKNDNQMKLVNKTVKNSCKVYIVLTIAPIVIFTVYTIYFLYYN